MVRTRTRPIEFFLALFICPAAFASTHTLLTGRVADASGEPLPGVTILVRNPALSVEVGAVTDRMGRYCVPGLPPAAGYRVRASLEGYATLEFSDLDLSAEGAVTLDFTLRPARDLQERVEVRGRPEIVDTESVTTSTTFNAAFLEGLPILGRDYQDILILAPGVTDVNDTGNPNVHGARDTGLVTLVDGVNTTDPLTGYFGQHLNIDSIEAVEVVTSGAPAEYSRAQGGFASILTKSGGNEFGGTFKLFVRSYRLDGDGAGIEPAELRGGLGGETSLRDLEFTDLYPFLSVSGPVVKNRLWYYVANEYLQIENPINALTHAFVIRTRGYREFGKLTWQMTPSHKTAFSVIVDRNRDENQGVTSVAALGSGYSLLRGGSTFSLKETAVFGPNHLLESTVSWFDNGFSRVPTLGLDTNHNGIIFVDQNGDGIFQARERDHGEDWDRDRAFDIHEDRNGNGDLDPGEDLDGDGRVTPTYGGCEGSSNEDLNCNGSLDAEVDYDMDGELDPNEDQGIYCPWWSYSPRGCDAYYSVLLDEQGASVIG
jgi:hypothetical protein